MWKVHAGLKEDFPSKLEFFWTQAGECRGQPNGDLSLISPPLMLINLQRLDQNLIYSLACGDPKLNTS